MARRSTPTPTHRSITGDRPDDQHGLDVLEGDPSRWPQRVYGWSIALLVPIVFVWTVLARSGFDGLIQTAVGTALLVTWLLLATAETVAWRTRNRCAS